MHVHCKLQQRIKKKNTYNEERFGKLLNVSDLIDVILLEFKYLSNKKYNQYYKFCYSM